MNRKPVVLMRGTWAILDVGADQAELGRVQATSLAAALRIAGRRFGVPAARLDAVAVLPVVYLREPEPGSPAAG